MAVLYHNPRCSKSRQAVELCEASSLDIDIHLYLASPLDYDTLHSLLSRLEGDISSAIRWSDKAFKDIDTPDIDRTNIDSIARFLSENGHLMQRPWFDSGNSTRIGRPVDCLVDLLE